MEPRLIQHQTQKLILSPQIRQYLRLLQLPIIELEQAVEQEMAENPLLEEAHRTREPDAEALPSASEDEADAGLEKPLGREEVRVGETFEHLQELDENFRESNFQDFSHQDASVMRERKDFQDTMLTKSESLSDYIMWQLSFFDLSDTEKKIAHEIIGNINDEGYLTASTSDMAQACKVSENEVQRILQKIKDLDPPGIAAKDLQEALIIQLKKKGNQDLALRIVTDHLPALEKRNIPALSRNLGVSSAEIKRALEAIIRLEPKPGRAFYDDEKIAVIPDATVTINTDSENDKKFKIELHSDSIPEVRINPYYRRLLRSKGMDNQGKAYLREKMQAALNFLKALSLRKSTLHEITEQIVNVQADFFEHGFSHLKPLRLKDVAQQIGIHESTVSRAIQGKHMATPQGTVAYKNFFSTKLESNNGLEESQKSIMEKIRSLVEKENQQKPLSDQKIVQLLKDEGVDIARRTVAKYRDLLKILPSHMRRKIA